MFATCLFCHADLGRNESLETFPVGRRLAYDGERGRLWVVCPRCERWNLSPLEERWEAIEDAERAYRATRRRAATDNIALARLADGLELVRIGRPLRPEFAAWRYGDQFGRRQRRTIAFGATAVVAGVAAFVVGPQVGLAIGGGSQLAFNAFNLGSAAWQNLVPRVRVRAPDGTLVGVGQNDAMRATLVAGVDGPRLTLHARRLAQQHRARWLPGGRSLVATLSREQHVLEGDVAQTALAALLPYLNRSGGREQTVREAVRVLEARPDARDLLRYVARGDRRWMPGRPDYAVSSIPKPLRLAAEMAVHEDDERRALEGELAALHARWEDAERIAHIADTLLLPEDLVARREALREQAGAQDLSGGR